MFPLTRIARSAGACWAVAAALAGWGLPASAAGTHKGWCVGFGNNHSSAACTAGTRPVDTTVTDVPDVNHPPNGPTDPLSGPTPQTITIPVRRPAVEEQTRTPDALQISPGTTTTVLQEVPRPRPLLAPAIPASNPPRAPEAPTSGLPRPPQPQAVPLLRPPQPPDTRVPPPVVQPTPPAQLAVPPLRPPQPPIPTQSPPVLQPIPPAQLVAPVLPPAQPPLPPQGPGIVQQGPSAELAVPPLQPPLRPPLPPVGGPGGGDRWVMPPLQPGSGGPTVVSPVPQVQVVTVTPPGGPVVAPPGVTTQLQPQVLASPTIARVSVPDWVGSGPFGRPTDRPPASALRPDAPTTADSATAIPPGPLRAPREGASLSPPSGARGWVVPQPGRQPAHALPTRMDGAAQVQCAVSGFGWRKRMREDGRQEFIGFHPHLLTTETLVRDIPANHHSTSGCVLEIQRRHASVP